MMQPLEARSPKRLGETTKEFRSRDRVSTTPPVRQLSYTQYYFPLLKKRNMPSLLHKLFYWFFFFFVFLETMNEQNNGVKAFIRVMAGFNCFYASLISFVAIFCIFQPKDQNLLQMPNYFGMACVLLFSTYSIILSSVILGKKDYNPNSMLIASLFMIIFASVGNPFQKHFCTNVFQQKTPRYYGRKQQVKP